MKELLLFILLIPSILIAQSDENKKPLTPYADIGFQDGFVVYTIGRNTTLLNPRLKPIVINLSMMKVKYANDIDNVSGAYIKKSQKAIRDYVNSEPVEQLSAKEQFDYIKLCSLLIIWDSTLSDYGTKELDKLTRSEDKEIKENAKLVTGLLEFYKEYNLKK